MPKFTVRRAIFGLCFAAPFSVYTEKQRGAEKMPTDLGVIPAGAHPPKLGPFVPVSEREGLLFAIAVLMDGLEPEWDDLPISKDTRREIAAIAAQRRRNKEGQRK